MGGTPATIDEVSKEMVLYAFKMAKAYRTISFEASCMIAGVPSIGIVIAEKARLYKIKHNIKRTEYDCDTPLPIKQWLIPLGE